MDGWKRVALVGLGGFFGSALRYSLGGWIQERMGPHFPWQTLLINVSGSLAIGLLYGLALQLGWDERWRLFLGIGVLGGYTTYSTFSYETVRLIEERSYLHAAGYFFGTAVFAVAAAFLGLILARLLTRGAA